MESSKRKKPNCGETIATRLITFQTKIGYSKCTAFNQDRNLILIMGHKRISVYDDRYFCIRIFTLEGYLVTEKQLQRSFDDYSRCVAVFSNHFIIFSYGDTKYKMLTDYGINSHKYPSQTKCSAFDEDGTLYTKSKKLNEISIHSNDPKFEKRKIRVKDFGSMTIHRATIILNSITLSANNDHGLTHRYQFHWYSLVTWEHLETLEFDTQNPLWIHTCCFDSCRNIFFIRGHQVCFIPYKDRTIRILKIHFDFQYEDICLAEENQIIHVCSDGRAEIYQIRDL